MSLYRNIALTVSSRGLGIVCGFFTTYYLARTVDKTALGEFFILEALVMVFTTCASLGMEVAGLRHIAISGAEERRRTIGFLYLFSGIVVAGSLALALGCEAVRWAAHVDEPLVPNMWYGLAFGLAFFLTEINGAILQGVEQFKALATLNIAVSVMNLILLLGMRPLGTLGLPLLVAARCLSLLAVFGLGTRSILKLYSPSLDRPLELFAELRSFAVNIWLNNIMTVIFLRLDTLAISWFMDQSSVALYEISRKLPVTLRSLFQSARAALFPNLSQELSSANPLPGWRKVNHLAALTVAGTAVMAVVGWMFSEQIMVLFFSQRYVEAAPAFSIAMFGLVMAFASNIYGTSLTCWGDSATPTRINVVGMAANLVLNATLIPRLGINGSALADAIASSATLPLNWFFARRKAAKAMAAGGSNG